MAQRSEFTLLVLIWLFAALGSRGSLWLVLRHVLIGIIQCQNLEVLSEEAD